MIHTLDINTIHNMDCMDGLKLLPDEYIDLVVTSPPYYNARDYSYWETYEDYLTFLKDVFTETYRVTKEGRMVVVNISTIIQPRKSRNSESKRIAIPFHFVNLMEEIGFKFLEDIIWLKPEGSSKNRNGNFYQIRKPLAYKPNIVNEYIFVFQKPSKRLIDGILRSYDDDIVENSLIEDGYERSNVWELFPENSVKGHSAPFPIELPDKIIKYYSFKNDLVLDMFMGSGTTAIASEINKRNWIGFELHEKYVDLAHKRIEKHT